jgi:hypothetical protein
MKKQTDKRKLGRAVKMAAYVMSTDTRLDAFSDAVPWHKVTCGGYHAHGGELLLTYPTQQPGIKPGDEVEVAVRLVKKPLDRRTGRG